MAIQILDSVTVTQISAGEVIDRPSSVVKELIENALDAGATRVQVVVDNGGKSRIQITDNGSGISREDLPLAPLRHATSKIRVLEDLYTLDSFGFRGEALASMAHVASLSILSRTADSEVGYELEAHLDRISKPVAVAHPVGTTITVSGLFDPVPVRQKFLKSAATEIGYCYDVVLHQLLVRPDVDFTLIHDGKTLLNSTGLKTTEDILLTVVGRQVKDQLVPVAITHGDLTVLGVVGRPTLTFSNRTKQWLSVNGRPIKGGVLTKTIQQAYEKLIPGGRFPLVVLNLQLAEGVDVNIHPQKHEVKFLRPGAIFEGLLAIIKSLFGASLGHAVGELLPPSSLSPFSSRFEAVLGEFTPQAMELFAPLSSSDSSMPVYWEYFQIFETYLVVKTPQGVVILDQHAVHERVLYEKLKTYLGTSGYVQPLASPEVVTLPADLMAIFGEVHSDLVQLGFMIEDFGGSSVVIREVPLDWSGVALGPFLIGLLTDIRVNGVASVDLETERRGQLQQKSCKAAIKAGKPLSGMEVRALLQAFMAIPDRETCPHGRPVSVTFDQGKLERLFLRV